MSNENNTLAREKVTQIIKEARVCMLVTMTEEGKHVSRPMGLQDVEFDGDIWFFTYSDSNKVTQIKRNPEVNVAISNPSSNAWVSMSGMAEEVKDMHKAEELWNPLLKAWFPDGLETPGLTLIKVNADSAEYWDSPNSKAIQLFGMVKAAVTGTPPKAGDNESVNL